MKFTVVRARKIGGHLQLRDFLDWRTSHVALIQRWRELVSGGNFPPREEVERLHLSLQIFYAHLVGADGDAIPVYKEFEYLRPFFLKVLDPADNWGNIGHIGIEQEVRRVDVERHLLAHYSQNTTGVAAESKKLIPSHGATCVGGFDVDGFLDRANQEFLASLEPVFVPGMTQPEMIVFTDTTSVAKLVAAGRHYIPSSRVVSSQKGENE